MRKVKVKIEDDMEIYTTDYLDPRGEVNVDEKNNQSYLKNKEKAEKNIYEVEDTTNAEAISDVINLKKNIDSEPIEPGKAYKFFSEQDLGAIDTTLLDLEVGGMAQDTELLQNNAVIPLIKMERLAEELNQLEQDLIKLEKDDIPNTFSSEEDAKHYIKEVIYLRDEM